MKPVKIGLAALLLVVAAAALLLSFNHTAQKKVFGLGMALEAKASGLSTHELTLSDHKISYFEAGPADSKQVVVLLHGFTADKTNWVRFVRHLPAEFRVIAPDWPAHGDSTYIEGADYSIQAQSDRLAQFLSQVQVDSAHLVGNSMGGGIAARFASDHPEQVASLTLMNTGGADNPATQSELEVLLEQKGANPLVVRDPSEFEQTLAFAMEQPPYIPWFAKDVLARQAASRFERYTQVFEQIYDGVTRTNTDYLTRIEAPTLIMWGDQDRLLSVSNAAVFDASIPDSEVLIYPGIGHLPMLEVPKRSAQDIAAFMQNHAN